MREKCHEITIGLVWTIFLASSTLFAHLALGRVGNDTSRCAILVYVNSTKQVSYICIVILSVASDERTHKYDQLKFALAIVCAKTVRSRFG